MKKNANKIIITILVLLTLFRIFLALKIPLFIQADAGYDDFLLVKYANNILGGNWLGVFDSLTLAKSISFSLFLCLVYLTGLPYSLLLILVYIFSILMFINVIRKLIPNKIFLVILYIFLLYSPIMFHIENTIKVYRGGLIISMALLTISLLIGLFVNASDSFKKMVLYSIFGGLSLSFFWYLKEDSIWLLPFVLGAISITVIYLIINKNSIKNITKRIIICLIPLLILVISNVIYSTINYKYYGVYTITDRSGTYYKEFLSDLLKIKTKVKKNNVWITKESVDIAMKNSKTFRKVKKEIDNMYDNSWALKDKEIEGDIIFWTLREAFEQAGYYSNAKTANEIYKNIDKELKDAFKNGKIKENKALYISKVGKGMSKKDIKYFKEITGKSLYNLATYDQNDISISGAHGSEEDVELMSNIINTSSIKSIDLESKNVTFKYSNYAVKMANVISDCYKKISVIILVVSLIGFVIFTISTILKMIHKDYSNISLYLITLGLIFSVIFLVIGVEWFCSWFAERKTRYIYNYSSAAVPLIQIIELICIYKIGDVLNKIRKNHK